MKILTGTKVLLTPMMESDLPFFWEVYSGQNERFLYNLAEGEKNKYQVALEREFIEGSMFGWIIHTNMGKKSQPIGSVWAKEFNEHTVEINGALIKKMLRGLASRLRRKKGEKKGYTYAEEALFLVTQYCFIELGKERVHAAIEDDNKLAAELTKRVGFKKEGILRKFAKVKENFFDIVMMGLTKEDFRNG